METKFQHLKWNNQEYRVAYNIKGTEGPLILYIHGWSHSKRGWLPIMNSCPDSYLQVALDLPGFGISTVPAGFDYKISSYAECLDAFLQTLPCKHHAMIAHSMGGLVGLTYLQNFANTFEKVAICGSPIEGIPFIRGLFCIPGLATLAMASRRFTPSTLMKYGSRFTIDPANIHKIPKDLIEDIKRPTTTTMVKALREVAFFHLPKIPIEGKKFLIVRGKKERILTKSVAKKYMGIFHARLEEIPDVCHTYMVEDIEEFQRILFDFLEVHHPSQIGKI